MNRREFLAAPIALPFVKTPAPDLRAEPIKGVGVLRVPSIVYMGPHHEEARQRVKELIASIRQGTVIALPAATDEHGNYLWDFRIEGGDPRQVVVENPPAASSSEDSQCMKCLGWPRDRHVVLKGDARVLVCASCANGLLKDGWILG